MEKRPLSGIRVAEFCEVASGPFCGMLLADLGADVVKIERPETGDSMRHWPPVNNGHSENFLSVNRCKRSVALDLKNPQDRDRAVELALAADVVVENYRPGVMKKLGLDYETLSAKKPGLVYCSISAFGQRGPRSTEGGFDLTMQAFAGVMSVTGDPEGAPVKCGVPLCDFTAGLYGAYTILAVLRQVADGDKGEHIDVSMLGTTLAVAALQTSEFFGTRRIPRKLGSAHPRNAPYQAFRARDGYFAMAAGNNRLWESVCDVVNQPTLLKDERFLDTTSRAANQVALKELLEEIFTKRDAADWLAALAKAGVPCAPINNYEQVLADPQVEALGWTQPITMPGGTKTKTFGFPVGLSGRTLTVESSSPELGNVTAEKVLEAWRS